MPDETKDQEHEPEGRQKKGRLAGVARFLSRAGSQAQKILKSSLTRNAGYLMMGVGALASVTGVGAVVGGPLFIAGAAVAGASHFVRKHADRQAQKQQPVPNPPSEGPNNTSSGQHAPNPSRAASDSNAAVNASVGELLKSIASAIQAQHQQVNHSLAGSGGAPDLNSQADGRFGADRGDAGLFDSRPQTAGSTAEQLHSPGFTDSPWNRQPSTSQQEAIEDAALHLLRTDKTKKKAYEESPGSMPALAKLANKAYEREVLSQASGAEGRRPLFERPRGFNPSGAERFTGSAHPSVRTPVNSAVQGSGNPLSAEGRDNMYPAVPVLRSGLEDSGRPASHVLARAQSVSSGQTMK